MYVTSMEDPLVVELTEVESQLVRVECELETLLQKQQELLERKQLLKAQIDSIKNVRAQEENTQLQATDWEHGVFPWTENVQSILNSHFRLESFRQLQLSCINSTLSKKDTILIMPTGGGKSLCYQLPAVISTGVTLVISPLVSLMEDQLMAVTNLGIESCMLNASSSREEISQAHSAMTDKEGNLKLLYVTPEKIAKSKRFMSKLEKAYEMGRLSRIVIDEVHCASQWGHDFRPDYKILGILKRQFPTTPILGLTATATAKVLADCQEMLSLKQCLIFRASYNRANLYYEVRPKPSSHKDHIKEIAQLIKTKFCKKSGIVYCFSRKDAEQVTLDLCQQGIRAGYYHADVPSGNRRQVHRQWLNNTIQVIVATVAFGMGIDKPDVRFVIHHSISKSMENYYQESGRAGRNGDPAHCIVYYRAADVFRQSTMVFTEHTGLQNLYTMLKYCLNETECRRALIARSFGEKWQPQDCKATCDVCERFSSASTESGPCSTSEQFVINEDVSECCRALIEIVEQAQAKEKRLTALKVVDALQGGRSWRSSSSLAQVQSSSGEKCERVLVHALLEGVLKEEFHFTPYSTISYMGLGRKAKAVKNGLLKIVMKSMKVDSCEKRTKPAKKMSSRTAKAKDPSLKRELGKGEEQALKRTSDASANLEEKTLCQSQDVGVGALGSHHSSDQLDKDMLLHQMGMGLTKTKKRKLPPSFVDSDSEYVSKKKMPRSVQRCQLPRKQLATALLSEPVCIHRSPQRKEDFVVIELDSD